MPPASPVWPPSPRVVEMLIVALLKLLLEVGM